MLNSVIFVMIVAALCSAGFTMLIANNDDVNAAGPEDIEATYAAYSDYAAVTVTTR